MPGPRPVGAGRPDVGTILAAERKSLEREDVKRKGVNRRRGRRGQAEVSTEEPAWDRTSPRGQPLGQAPPQDQAASAGAPNDRSIGRANRAPRRR